MLERRERELLHEIQIGIESDLMYEAAEKVREAHLGLLKGKKHFAIYPNEDDRLRGQKINLELEDWKKKSIKDIITIYKMRANRGHS